MIFLGLNLLHIFKVNAFQSDFTVVVSTTLVKKDDLINGEKEFFTRSVK